MCTRPCGPCTLTQPHAQSGPRSAAPSSLVTSTAGVNGSCRAAARAHPPWLSWTSTAMPPPTSGWWPRTRRSGRHPQETADQGQTGIRPHGDPGHSTSSSCVTSSTACGPLPSSQSRGDFSQGCWPLRTANLRILSRRSVTPRYRDRTQNSCSASAGRRQKMSPGGAPQDTQPGTGDTIPGQTRTGSLPAHPHQGFGGMPQPPATGHSLC